MKKDRRLQITIDENMYQLLRINKFYQNRSIGDIVREAITKHVKPIKKGEYDK